MSTDKKIKKLEKKISELENRWKRALADYLNLEKRIEKEKESWVKFSNAVLIDKLLGVLDDLERAEKHFKDKGLTMAVDQLRRILQSEGVEEIGAQGKRFDAEAMDCVAVVKGAKNVVVEVVNKGYKLRGRVLRPAKVKVGGGKK